jgi:Transposase DDE domain
LRKQTVEPVFGQVKDVRGARRFMRRGLRACAAGWKLLCGTHYPDVRVMPRWWRLPLVGGRVRAGLVGIITAE